MIDPPSVKSGSAFLHREDQTLDVAVKGFVEVFLGDGAQRGKFTAARIGEQNVDAALLLLDGGVKAVEVGEIRDVALHTGDVLSDFLHGGVQLGLAAAGDEDVRALRDKAFGGGQADAAVASGDDRYFSFELTHGIAPVRGDVGRFVPHSRDVTAGRMVTPICTSWYRKAYPVKAREGGSRRRNPRGKLGRPRAFDADKVLDRALQVFWRKGYEGTSLSDLTNAMGINRPSLYAAFGDKEALFRKVLDRYADGPASYVGKALEEPRARAVMERLLRETVEASAKRGNPKGCLMVQSTLACGKGTEPIRRELIARRAAGEAAVRRRFDRAKTEGDLPANVKSCRPRAVCHGRPSRNGGRGGQWCNPHRVTTNRQDGVARLARLKRSLVNAV